MDNPFDLHLLLTKLICYNSEVHPMNKTEFNHESDRMLK